MVWKCLLKGKKGYAPRLNLSLSHDKQTDWKEELTPKMRSGLHLPIVSERNISKETTQLQSLSLHKNLQYLGVQLSVSLHFWHLLLTIKAEWKENSSCIDFVKLERHINSLMPCTKPKHIDISISNILSYSKN